METRKILGYGLLVAGLIYIAKKSKDTKTKRASIAAPLTKAQQLALNDLRPATTLTIKRT